MSLTNIDLKAVVSKIDELPTLPQVAMHLVALVDDPQSSAADVHRVMSRDPALAGKILRLANSAFYALPNKISDLSHAITILGFRTIRSMALTVSVMDAFKAKDSERTAFNHAHYWRHSIASACVYRKVAARENLDIEEAFVAGLMHDIGKLVLDIYVPQLMQKILEMAEKQSMAFHEAEHEIMDTNHAEIGAWLAESWQLSPSLCHLIRYHHVEDNDYVDKPIAIARFSDYICKVKNVICTGSHEAVSLDSHAWDLLSMERSELPGIIQELNQELQSAESFLTP